MSKIILAKYHQREIFIWFGQSLVLEVAYISYNTGTRASPDIYALALGSAVPLDIVHMYQATHPCLCYNLYL